ncbi:heat shock 70 kDa protein 12A-like [Mya arenaria]|uniref:heat shock 70 kDa protein 12A-like n=1 Tax=Mya arenaria TaxID=6604 RepID=UPI0022E1C829|nr:heat shock 70 kDa protein 12A-like [Mya arenaria]
MASYNWTQKSNLFMLSPDRSRIFDDNIRRKTRSVVAAIDFGTTYSGYAYSFPDLNKTDPFKIYANADWTDGSRMLTPKAPTVVLFDKARRFHSFGYNAETKYNDLAYEDEHKGWRYFRRFRTTIFQNNRLSPHTEIDDEQGQKMLALDVFAAAIQFLKDHLLTRLRDIRTYVLPTDIDWVLTVPAIWEDEAKKFMTIAANQAGIPGDQLTLVYEYEAAAVYCKGIKDLSKDGGQASESFGAGSKFMVIDLGDTADIIVHEVQHDGKLVALAAISGGPWGGILVDRQLEKFLIDLFGKDVIDKFSEDCKPDKLDMDRMVEVKKTTDKFIKGFKLYRELKNKDFDKSLLETDFSQTVSNTRDKLHVANTVFLDMFKESKEKVINHVEAQLKHTDLGNVKTIMMVGGFSESEIMQEAIKERFEDKGYEVIVPEQAGLAVVKGAVLYGYKPDSFCSGKMPFTYGFADYEPRKTRLVVAAIDFGTAYSGYAYSFLDEYKKDPFKIYANADWSDGTGLVTPKAPTIVLFDKAKRFHSFGYKAETKYNDLANGDEHKGWRYFKRFKMTLFQNNRLSLRTQIDDEQGQKMLALDVFAAAIQFLKDHLLARLKNRSNDFRPTDIDWVLTVPAIWEDAAKQFMIIAADQAGIPGDQLTLAYEPEAAAVFCKEIKVDLSTEGNQASELKSFSEGSKFMIIDLGGGTADITVHEVQNDRTLAALAAPSGGPWGGTLVDGQLDKFLIGLFGKDVIDKFSEDCKPDKLDMDRMVEIKKRQIDSSSDKVHIKLPNELFDLYRELNNKDFDKSLLETDFSQTVSKTRDRLHVANKIFLDMFKESKEKLINHVEAQLRRTDLRNVKTIMMVGGFSESEIMQEAIKERFKDKGYEVIVPEQAGLAVVKGAVIYGHNPDSICSRKMPFTYGISTAVPFEDNLHARVHRYVRADGKEMCEDIFKTFTVKGEKVVPRKTSAKHTFQSPAAGNTRVTVEVYKSVEDTPPMYTTDCKRVGELVLHTRSCQVDQKALINVKMMFGGTKVSVEAQEQGTMGMNKVEAEFDWLKN